MHYRLTAVLPITVIKRTVKGGNCMIAQCMHVHILRTFREHQQSHIQIGSFAISKSKQMWLKRNTKDFSLIFNMYSTCTYTAS